MADIAEMPKMDNQLNQFFKNLEKSEKILYIAIITENAKNG